MHQAAPALFIIFNASPGRDDTAEARQRVVDRLQAAGRRVQTFIAGWDDDLSAVIGRAINAARDARGVVVAAGGDGTLNAVAQAVWNASLVMGVLPRGACSYFARAHGIPVQLDSAIDALLRARAEPVTVGQVGERVFLVSASVGLYPRLPQERERVTREHGRPVALLDGLGSLLRGQSVMTLELHSHGETRVVRTRTLLVGHNAPQLRVIGLREALAVEAGRLTAITLQPLPVPRTLWLVLRGAIGRLDGAESVDSFAFERLVVQPRRGAAAMKVSIDGEIVRLPAPLVFQTAPRPLQLLVPQGMP